MPLDRIIRRASSETSEVVTKALSALRHRNFRLFFFGQSISMMGTWVHNTALSWLVYSITYDPRSLGWISFVGAVPVLLLSAVAGTIADEYPKRRILIWTQVLASFMAFALAISIYTDNTSLVLITIINFFFGVSSAFEMPTRQSFVVEMVGREDLSNAVALNSAVFNGARLAGPVVGAAVMASMGMAACFLINGISFIAVIFSLAAMRFAVKEENMGAVRVSRLAAMKEGVLYLASVPQFRALMVLVVAMTMFGWSYSVNLPVIADKVLRGESGMYALLLAANGAGALVAAITQAAFAHKFDPRNMIFTGIGVFVVSILLIPFSSEPWQVMFWLVGTGWGIITFFITANTYLQHRVPDSLRGRVMGIYTLSFAGLFPFGSLLAGYLAHAFGVRAAFLTSGLALLVIGGLVYYFTYRIPRLQPLAQNR
ncbi:MAG TPA: MFS transporter [Candidatus Kapabacteria bacterium]|nr:MFS transporter [Candidatus Kapabacteria bacterium]